METVPEVEGSGPLWTGWLGSARVDAIADKCVIDLLDYSDSRLEFRVRGGGTRSYGLRNRAIDPGILSNNANFFASLRASVAESGIKLPVLLYGINGKLWVRYGASRIHTAIGLGLDRVPAVLCHWKGHPEEPGFLKIRELRTPAQVLDAFGPPAIVGHFVADHERIDAHRMEP